MSETIGPPPLQDKLNKQLSDWLHDEVIKPFESPWSSPLMPVMKKSGKDKWCVDFRAVNKVTVTNSYPTPCISDTLDSLGSSKIFSTLDAANGYNVIPVEEKSHPLTAFATPFSLWQFAACPLV